MAEWSNATVLSTVIFGCAGSNPARCKIKESNSVISNFIPKQFLDYTVPIAQSVERRAYIAFVAGSSPAGNNNKYDNSNKHTHFKEK